MWNPFKRSEHVIKTKSVDWNKVKTIEDVILILSGINFTKHITVGELYWNDPRWKALLGTTITEKKFIDGREVECKEYEEPTT